MHYLLFIVVFLLGGCSTVSYQPIDKRAHQQNLSNVQHWQIKGRFAFQSADEKFSASLNWKHSPEQFQFRLSSLVGSEILMMESDGTSALLRLDGKTYRDESTSKLVTSLTGWNIPVEQLTQWVKGATPDMQRSKFDELGRVSSFVTACSQCERWQIHFGNYESIDDVYLPTDIKMQNLDIPTNRIRIKVNTWTVTP